MLRFHVREVERLMRVRFEACTRTNAKRKEAAMNNSDNKNDDNDGEKARTDGACTERLGRVGAMLGIIDLDGFGLMKFSSEFVSFLKSISKVDQDNYPEILGTLVVVNAPTVVASVMWPVVRCFLDKRTQDKIKFFSCYQQKVRSLLRYRTRHPSPRDRCRQAHRSLTRLRVHVHVCVCVVQCLDLIVACLV